MNATTTFDALARVLADARARFGEDVFQNRRRLIGLLSDHVPEAKREIRAMGTAIAEGVPDALRRAERHLIGMEMDRQAERLEAMTGLRVDIARPVVRAFAFGLGLGPLPSIYVAAESVQPVPANVWQGVSEPVAAAGAAQSDKPAPGTFRIAGRDIPRYQIGLVAALAAAAVLATDFIGGSGDGANVEQPPQASQNPSAQQDGARPVEPPAPAKVEGKAPASDTEHAQESTDFGIAEKATLESNVGSPTPLGIPVGRRVTTAEVQRILRDDSTAVLIDVLDGPHDGTIRGALFMPGLGNGGTLSDNTQTRLEQALAKATGNDRARKLIFFCYGAHCWESYNAVLRANAARYTNIYWYRGGLSAWQAAGLPMQRTPEPSG